MAPKLRFQLIQSMAEPNVTSTGELNQSREDLVVGDILLVVAEDIQGAAVFDLLAPPPGSTSQFVPITPLSEALLIDVTGRWRCRVADTFDGSRVQHTFAAPTVKRGLIPPAHNERASEDANEVDPDPGTWVDESESNAGGKFTGYTDDVHKLFAAVEADAEAVKLDVPSEFDSVTTVTAVAGDKVLIEIGSDGTKHAVDAAAFLADSDDQTAAEVPFSPDGDIASTDTQAAIVEVRDDTDVKLTGKAPVSHVSDLGNPHAVTAAQAGAYTKSEVDVLVDATMKAPEAFAPSGTYPVTYDGAAVQRGDSFRITSAGTVGAVTVNTEDLLIALVDTPGQVDASWMVAESNRDQATETVKGVAELATQAEADAGTNDANIITPLKMATAPVNAHDIVEHDTTATGAELTQMTDGSSADGLHKHDSRALLSWKFSTNQAEADPGSGNFRMDSATPSSVTTLYFDSVTVGGLNIDNFFTKMAVGDQLGSQQADDTTKVIVFEVSDPPTDNTGWWTVPVTVSASSGSLFTNNKSTLWVIPFSGFTGTASGAQLSELVGGGETTLHSHAGGGDVVGPASVVDDRLAAFDGTTGKLLKQGGKTATEVGSHLDSTTNPHGVTAAQAGAAPTAHTHTHASTTGQGTDDHHAQSHALAGSDHASATLAELNAKVSDATLDDVGATRTPSAHTIASHDTDATGPQLDSLTDGSDANGLHIHAPAQLFLWSFSTNTSAANPGSGNVRANNATPGSITAIYFSSIDADGMDFDRFFSNVPVGDAITVQQTDDASKLLILTVSSALTDNGGWWTMPVTVESDAGGLFSNNKDTSWLIRMRM